MPVMYIFEKKVILTNSWKMSNALLFGIQTSENLTK